MAYIYVRTQQRRKNVKGKEHRAWYKRIERAGAFDWLRHIEFSFMGSRVMGFVRKDLEMYIYILYYMQIDIFSSTSSNIQNI